MTRSIASSLLCWLALPIGLAAGGCRTLEASHPTSPMDPHFKASGPWFEGWYTHVVDQAGKRDFAVVMGSFVRAEESFATSARAGYVALVVHDQKSGTTTTHEAFPERTTLTAGGAPVVADPDDKTPADFRWQAAGLGAMTQSQIDVEFPDGTAFHSRLGTPEPINPAKPWVSPEGPGAKMPFIWSHWYIFSIASRATYEYRGGGGGGPVSGDAVAHLEKNYGYGFPTAWLWTHALADGGKTRLSLAGGPAPMSVVQPEVWTVAFRAGDVDWLFFPGIKDLTVKREMDACAGTMHMTLWNPQRRLEVLGSAPPGSFVGIATPSPTGWVKAGAHESYNAKFQVSAFDLDMFGRPSLKQKVTFDQGVLEFGGAFRCPTVKL